MRRTAAALLCGGLILAGCGGATGPNNNLPPRPEEVESQLAQASDQFGISLLKEIYGAEKESNLFISPVSASVILSLTANGARGETQEEMLATLGFDQMSIDHVNEANLDLLGILSNPADPGVELTQANAVWYRTGMEVAPEFRKIATETYGAQIEAAEFGRPAAAEAINRWVSNQTRKRIPNLFEETTPDMVMILVNALYFKGDWQHPFEKAQTYEEAFHLIGGKTKQVEFMHQEDEFGYLKEEGLTAVRLPYGEGGISFYAFMPDDWDRFVDSLTAEKYQTWVNAMGEREIRLAMPRVRLQYEVQLIEPLTAMGMVRAFRPGEADLSGLFTDRDGLYISEVLQKTFLEIDEKGTEAAAATGVVVKEAGAPVDPNPSVRLDHPFLLSIRDDRTGVTLFMGAVVEP